MVTFVRTVPPDELPYYDVLVDGVKVGEVWQARFPAPRASSRKGNGSRSGYMQGRWAWQHSRQGDDEQYETRRAAVADLVRGF